MMVPTRPVKHSFTLAGHRTSISLEAAFWDALRAAARREGMSLAELVVRIDRERGAAGLSSAVRVWVLAHVRGLPAEASAPPAPNAAASAEQVQDSDDRPDT